MDNTGYVALTRQAGLLREMQAVANNIANASTTGFRREGIIFSEYVQRVEGGPSLSMATGDTRHMDLRQAGLSQTGGTFDFAIQGEGFFQLQTPNGPRLTRAGSFTPAPTGECEYRRHTHARPRARRKRIKMAAVRGHSVQ